MADLVVGLARSVVKGALTKAQAAIEEEAKLRQSAQHDLVFITDEFEMMHSFLKVANPERIENEVVMTWVRQVRELAYDVEDCIEFVVHLNTKTKWWWRMVPLWCMEPPVEALSLDEAVDQIMQLKARVVDVSQRNARYKLISDTGSKPVVVHQQQPAPTTASVLIGTGRKQQGDLTQLFPEEEGELQVISVWGTCTFDLGMTTSVIWKAYNDQESCQNFTCRAWVKLVHPFNPRVFIRCLAIQFYANSCKEQEGEIIGVDVLNRSSEATEDDHLEEFEQRVNNKRYHIVLEDLSTMTDWDAIRKFFPERRNGSCIIVSTQQSELATLSVGDPYKILDLNQFSVEQSLYAFYKERSECDVDQGEETGNNKVFASSVVANSVRHVIIKKKMSVKQVNSARSNKKTINWHLIKVADDWTTKHPLVGGNSEMNDLRRYAIKARFYKFQVVSVWGIAGVGKSALLTNLLCNTILEDCRLLLEKKKPSPFDKYGWVDVSYPFNLRDFSQSLLLNFHFQSLQAKDHDIDMVGIKNPILKCRGILEQHKCLVIIDGLQSTKEWDLIQAEIVAESSDNCIIVVTTEASIAGHCQGKMGELVFNVKGLQADTAFELFEKKVSSKNPSSPILTAGDDAELRELISKCGGLPKVIVEIAGLLANKSVGWKAAARSINDKFMHHMENNREFDSLQGVFGWIHTYFRHTCPESLKPCIFYMSIFPGSCPIRRRQLIRRWIAEGYSRDSHEESAEENGEKQFSSLLNLSIIQQTSWKIQNDTSMISFNGFIREYIASKRMEENLGFELGASSTMTTQRTGRHLVILDKWKRDRIVFESMDFSRLRSLTVFGDWKPYFISESMKLLQVLDLENAKELEDDDIKKMVKVLLRLKFLSLRGHKEISHLPSSLHHLRQLQTLDVRGTSITTLPEKITKLQKLQYIRAGTLDLQQPVSSNRCSWLPEFCICDRPTVGVEVPIGIGKVIALHTLGVVDVAASGATIIVEELKQLTQLRKLGVSGINRKNSGKFFSAIKDHEHLESMSVRLDKDNQGCYLKNGSNRSCLDSIHLPLENLRSLKVHGLNDRLPNWSDQLKKLAKIDLEMATLTEENGMNILGELPQLCSLRVKQLEDGGLHFRVVVNEEENVSYKKVKVLQIACGGSSSTLRVEFGEATMKKLELLKIDCHGGSPTYQFFGLENLRELKQILLLNSSNSGTLKQQFESQLAEHPNKPIVKLEEPPRSS